MYKTALEQSDLFKHGTGVVFLINFIFIAISFEFICT
jgi:hypothetical protein